MATDPARTNTGTEEKPQQGLALIIVLGMIAVLMIMGVAFSVSMRVERMGAGSFRFGVNSRNMVWAGLARAIDDINTVMATNGYVYPNWEVLPSAGVGGGVRVVFGDSLMYVPAGLTGIVEATDSQWIIGASQGGGIDDGSLQGRVAYLVVNESGGLDANVIGGSNRVAGTDPAEISISNLTEMADVARFLSVRSSPDERYETLPELAILQASPRGGLKTSASASPSNLVVYSRAVPGYLIGSNTTDSVLNIGVDATALPGIRTDITTKLASIGLLNSGLIYSNLLDYVDTDWIPQDLMACVESVPMVNEIAPMPTTLRLNAGSYAFSPMVLVELFYPFVKAVNDTFTLRTTIETKIENTTSSTSATRQNTVSIPSGYVANTSTNWYRAIPCPGGAPSVPGNPGDQLKITITLISAEVVSSGGDVVDCVPYPTNGISQFLFTTNIAAPDPSVSIAFKSLECVDPRVNWKRNPYWLSCKSGNDTRNAENSVTTERLVTFGQSNPALGLDWDTKMFVSNRGRLLSVGEMGNLLRESNPFRTIRLFDHTNSAPRDRVLMVFSVQDPPLKRGLVNPNTINGDVLKAVFSGIPLGYSDPGNVLSPTELDAIVTAFTNARISSSVVFTNVADIGLVNYRAALPTRSDLERESVIASSCGLFHTRQNLFAIFVAAGPFAPGLGVIARRGGGASGDWLGYQRAVFEVWRDPFPNAQGKHPCMVRTFKWLDGGN